MPILQKMAEFSLDSWRSKIALGGIILPATLDKNTDCSSKLQVITCKLSFLKVQLDLNHCSDLDLLLPEEILQ